MFKLWAQRAWCLSLALIITVSSISSLQAHNTSNKAESIEAHRKTDFEFNGFNKLNKQLQKDFNSFNYAAAAAAYQRSLRMESAVDAHLLGQWSPVFNLPVVAIHAAVLPDRKILIWDSVGDLPSEQYETHNTTRAIIWDPTTGVATRSDVNTGFNLFCAGHAALPDGRQFIAGGNLNSSLSGLDKLHTFNSTNNSWTLLGRMNEGGRWYPSVTALANGEMLITSGGPFTSEVYNQAGGLRSLTTAVLEMPLYPWIQAAPNGNAFYFGPDDNLRYLNTNGSGAWQNLGGREGIYRSYGSYAMYDTGKVLAAGGSNSVKNTVVIDFKSRRPQVTRAGDLNAGRRQHNLTVLPNGTVLATGGNSDGTSLISLTAGVYTAELWNPATGNWTNLASMQKTRQYHSMALLLPDARVMVGGGGICGDCYDVGYLEKNIEIFSPPYLFKQDGSGQLAPRPSINAAPSEISYRQNFDISTENPKNIRQVVLIRPSSVTHSVNFEQRRIPLSFAVKRNGFQATAPSDANIAPPGYYMMFIIDGSGVPSVAKMVKLS
ncbi:MAG TPA: galactose oxidase-like domain-containing protein [Pyrinomonadaceae bacterium]|jgi:WD40 repeat protein